MSYTEVQRLLCGSCSAMSTPKCCRSLRNTGDISGARSCVPSLCYLRTLRAAFLYQRMMGWLAQNVRTLCVSCTSTHWYLYLPFEVHSPSTQTRLCFMTEGMCLWVMTTTLCPLSMFLHLTQLSPSPKLPFIITFFLSTVSFLLNPLDRLFISLVLYLYSLHWQMRQELKWQPLLINCWSQWWVLIGQRAHGTV